jgi:hypothetical protein
MRRVAAHTTGVDHDGIDELLLASKQDPLKVNGQPISSVVLDTFIIGGSEENNATNSLLTAKAIEDWFEQVNQHLVMISPGQQGPSVRVGSINASSPSRSAYRKLLPQVLWRNWVAWIGILWRSSVLVLLSGWYAPASCGVKLSTIYLVVKACMRMLLMGWHSRHSTV